MLAMGRLPEERTFVKSCGDLAKKCREKFSIRRLLASKGYKYSNVPLAKDWIVLNLVLMLLGKISQLNFQTFDCIKGRLKGNCLHFVGLLLCISLYQQE